MCDQIKAIIWAKLCELNETNYNIVVSFLNNECIITQWPAAFHKNKTKHTKKRTHRANQEIEKPKQNDSWTL